MRSRSRFLDSDSPCVMKILHPIKEEFYNEVEQVKEAFYKRKAYKKFTPRGCCGKVKWLVRNGKEVENA